MSAFTDRLYRAWLANQGGMGGMPPMVTHQLHRPIASRVRPPLPASPALARPDKPSSGCMPAMPASAPQVARGWRAGESGS